MNLTTNQQAILASALQRDDGTLELAPDLKGSAALVSKLLAGGLVEEIPASDSMPVWRKDDQDRPVALQITGAGLPANSGRSARSETGGRCRSKAAQQRKHTGESGRDNAGH